MSGSRTYDEVSETDSGGIDGDGKDKIAFRETKININREILTTSQSDTKFKTRGINCDFIPKSRIMECRKSSKSKWSVEQEPDVQYSITELEELTREAQKEQKQALQEERELKRIMQENLFKIKQETAQVKTKNEQLKRLIEQSSGWRVSEKSSKKQQPWKMETFIKQESKPSTSDVKKHKKSEDYDSKTEQIRGRKRSGELYVDLRTIPRPRNKGGQYRNWTQKDLDKYRQSKRKRINVVNSSDEETRQEEITSIKSMEDTPTTAKISEESSKRLRIKGIKRKQFLPKETSTPIVQYPETEPGEQHPEPESSTRADSDEYVPVILLTDVSGSTNIKKRESQMTRDDSEVTRETIEMKNNGESTNIKSSDSTISIGLQKDNQPRSVETTVTLSEETEDSEKHVEPETTALKKTETSGGQVQPTRLQEEERVTNPASDDKEEGVKE
ncbi:golgin subfamily A member 6-like protein 6 [Harpegnathos saltator]|uniref:golgin subfamily A member 6-like protein 6 n=1 Tax=Harpegnathos saltator TaxID=610380 RepID=UPI000DBEDE97|nr:golgin subfamily A member 6-like protein 6 [Harpegnathos saltator]